MTLIRFLNWFSSFPSPSKSTVNAPLPEELGSFSLSVASLYVTPGALVPRQAAAVARSRGRLRSKPIPKSAVPPRRDRSSVDDPRST